MNKREAIEAINRNAPVPLNSANTCWAKVITYGAREGWWLTIPFRKFENELHILLNSDVNHQFIHITMPTGIIEERRNAFRNRSDIDKADIFISSAGNDYLIDVQSGGTRHNFANYPAMVTTYADD